MAKAKDKVEEKVVEETPAPAENNLKPFEEQYQKDMNQMALTGRLARDPELKYSENGRGFCRMYLFNHRDYYLSNGNGDEDRQLIKHTNCFPIVFFGRIAEIAGTYPKTGDLIGLESALDQQRWVDNFGQERSYIRVLGRQIYFLRRSSKRADGTEEMKEIALPPTDNVTEAPEDDIPF
ncbi:MAG: single-stranded DNA-binding protein [Pseudomonadota bacterium]